MEVWPRAVVPRFSVAYSRMTVRSPMISLVGSPAYFRRCGFCRRIRKSLAALRIGPEHGAFVEDAVGADRDVAIEQHVGPQARPVADRHPRSDDAVRTDGHVPPHLGRLVDDCGRVDALDGGGGLHGHAPVQRSTTRAIMSASATTWRSTMPTPRIFAV